MATVVRTRRAGQKCATNNCSGKTAEECALAAVAGFSRSCGQGQGGGYEDTTTVLFDLHEDPEQLQPFRDEGIEKRLLGLMDGLMRANEAPPEAFTRLGLSP